MQSCTKRFAYCCLASVVLKTCRTSCANCAKNIGKRAQKTLEKTKINCDFLKIVV